MTDDTRPDAFALQFLLVGCTAEIALNDVPLAATDLRRLQGSVHATPWVVDGTNELRLSIARSRRLDVLPVGAVALDREAGPILASAGVMAGFYADLVPDRERDPTLAEVAWLPVDDGTRVLPHVTTRTFVARGRPRWAWQDAPPPALAGDERAEVVAFVREVHDAFARRDAAAVVSRMTTLAREAVHFGPSSADFAAAFSGELLRATAEPGYAVAPYREDEIALRPIAHGRVVRVLHTSGGSFLRAPADAESPWSFRLDLARIDGRLEIARIG